MSAGTAPMAPSERLEVFAHMAAQAAALAALSSVVQLLDPEHQESALATCAALAGDISNDAATLDLSRGAA